ncbi:solute carrier family 23 protein [Schaalia sp. ORNL0103]|uniref:solute carrier family 23 protein n=1 Tax=Schaalia sp. ORNL0103 TaxID=2789426 RepID=UPI001CA4BC2C|nr:solute carrier family 23 protein [Schaalia sp. ORNL0103]MBW6413029.1 purine/pyrimidine permease [Schaalia sp. ORNL0103]
MASSPSSAPHPVDQVPPFGKLTILGIQHVLAFYAGAVVVPLVIVKQLGLDDETLIHLINADLLTCGIATIIQSAGIGRFIGVKLPLIQGVTFTAVSPLIAIGAAATPPGADPKTGLATMYGSIIAVGLIVFLVAPFFAKLLRFFPPVVTGTLLTVMGTTLLSVSADDILRWTDDAPADTKAALTLESLAYAIGTIVIIVLIQRLFKGFMGTLSVLLGLVIMTGVAFAMGKTDLTGVGNASWVAVTHPFFFGLPQFSITAIIAMIIVMAVTAVETTGDVFATGEVVGKRIAPRDIANALRADGLSTLLGGVLNSFPYTCFAQNVGLVRLTRVKSRWVVTAAGVFMIILGLLPKAAAIVAAIPSPVIGGASLAMFANVAVVGIQTLSKVDLRDSRNAVIVSTSIGLALLVTFRRADIVAAMPSWLQIIFGSGVTIGSLTAIILNLLFFHIGRPASPDVAVVDGKKINLDDVNAMDRDQFVATFSSMFSAHTWPVERAWESRPFASVSELRSSFEDAVLAASPEEAEELIASYTDVVSLVLDGAGDEQASTDTSSLSVGDVTSEEAEELRALAAAYREKFGRPLVICVDNVVDRKHLLSSGWRRVEHSPAREARFALGEVIDIADLRFDQLVADANPMRAAWDAGFERL